MKTLSLISDSGIQIHKFDLSLSPATNIVSRIGYFEELDLTQYKVRLNYAIYLPEDEIWASKIQLLQDGYLIDGKLAEDIDTRLITKLDEETQCYTVNNIDNSLELYADNWLPIPYFELSGQGNYHFGAINWCRLKLVPVDIKGKIKHYSAVLVFDTKTAKSIDDYESPSSPEYKHGMTYQLCGDLDMLLNYCDKRYRCEWVDDYLKSIYERATGRQSDEAFPRLKYLANYIYLVHYLSKTGFFPDVQLFPNKVEDAINVDMVVDIGNSRTCGILFEDAGNQSFKFTEVKKLSLQDLSNPGRSYEDSFEMNLAFHKCSFGDLKYNDTKFRWPSFIRIGPEAKRLIYLATNEASSYGKESFTYHSSPKRYLWDENEAPYQWELIKIGNDDIGGAIHLEGISEQFNRNGTLVQGNLGFEPETNFSRKSLMTFVFIEIIAQALAQINSNTYREKHGEANRPRKLRWLVVTCPTAMIQAEQVALRQCAQDAAIALQRYYEGNQSENFSTPIQVLPTPKDLAKSLADLDTKKDWSYDEATCCQLVFLYAEISQRYRNKCEPYFDLYGKVRKDLNDNTGKSITIGSIDIGAGTTDLMICAYQYNSMGTAVIKPTPLYWESFTHAGDTLLKKIIQQIIIQGSIDKENYLGCTGVIENEAKRRNTSNLQSKLNNFFGYNSNNMDYHARQLRRRFNTQIAVPIAERYLEHANKGLADEIVTYADLFPVFKPAQELLDYFEEHFGFRFEDIKWRLSKDKVFEVIETEFEPMIKQICTLLFAKGCDFVLLAGRPTSLSKIYDLFLKFYPTSPDRIICLNDYRVGRWYPFQDGNGYFTDKKSIVAVGAAIALMGGKMDHLKGFRFNMDIIKKQLVSTVNYLGFYDTEGSRISTIILEPDLNKNQIEVAGFPVLIGFKALSAKTYPGRLIYVLDFDDDKIKEKRSLQLETNQPEALSREVEIYKNNIKNRSPFKLNIYRDFRTSKEELIIESIEDKNRDLLPTSIFKLQLKTMDEDKAYWLDTGEFFLKVEVK